MWTLIPALWLSVASAADPVPLELPTDADPAWAGAAALSGFTLEPCETGPCARLEQDRITVVHPSGVTEVLAVGAGEAEDGLARVQSRLALGPPESGRAAAAPVPRERVTRLGPVSAVVAGPDVGLATERALDVRLPEAAPPTTVPERAREPVRTALRSSVGLADAPVFGAVLGRQGRVAWVAAGGRLDGSGAVEMGGGVHAGSARFRLSVGVFGGAEFTPDQCLLCSVDTQAQDDGTTVVRTAGVYTAAADSQRWSPLVRVETGPVVALTRTVALQPRIDGVWSRRGLRPELGLGLIWQPG